ncbi:MAG: purine-nucleoside phosphorylase [Planctomycetaceae bacterium]
MSHSSPEAQTALSSFEVQMAAEAIRNFANVGPDECVAEWGMVLGSGLGHVGDTLVQNGGKALPYDEIPGFPVSAIPGHAGRLVLGNHNGTNVIVLQGRSHFYEGHDIETITLPVRSLLQVGVTKLLLTNASGGVNLNLRVGNLMLIDGHISMLPAHLIGDRSLCVWDADLIAHARTVAERLGIPIQSGVYAAMPGPTYETSAEVRMMRILGADAVGMSTVPEAVAAAGRARVLGISCITNAAAGIQDGPITHDHVAEVGRSVSDHFGRLVFGLLDESEAADSRH